MAHSKGAQVEFDVVIKRSARRKTVALRILNARTVELRAPAWVSDRYLDELLRKRAEWLQEALAKCPSPLSYRDGDKVMLHGRMHTLRWFVPQGRGAVCCVDDVLYLPVSNEPDAAKALMTFLRERAVSELTSRCQQLAEQVGRQPSRIQVRSFSARWGSCDTRGVIKLNWRLVMAPDEVRDYVIFHELAHMVEMNHSVHFWREVATWVPNYKAHCQWLKKNGPGLLAVGHI